MNCHLRIIIRYNESYSENGRDKTSIPSIDLGLSSRKNRDWTHLIWKKKLAKNSHEIMWNRELDQLSSVRKLA